MSSNKNNLLYEKTSFLQGSNSPFIKELYLQFLNNPKNVPQSWAEFFEGLDEDQDIVKKEITIVKIKTEIIFNFEKYNTLF